MKAGNSANTTVTNYIFITLFVFFIISSVTGMDVHTIIDSISDIMTHEDKDIAKTGELAMQILFETAAIVLGNRLKVRIFVNFSFHTRHPSS